MENNNIQNFLLKEYEECYNQLRYYDTRTSNLFKYLFGLTSIIATALFALFKLTCDKTLHLSLQNEHIYLLPIFLSIVASIGSILIVFAMVENRKYFIFVAKQLNAIRKNFIATSFDNQMYTATNFSTFRLKCLHTYKFIGAVLLSSTFLGFSAYWLVLFYRDFKKIILSFPYIIVYQHPIIIGIITSFISFVIIFIICRKFLKDIYNKNADEAILGVKASQASK